MIRLHKNNKYKTYTDNKYKTYTDNKCFFRAVTELCTVAICKDLLSYCNSCICTWKSVVHLGTVTM